MRWRRRYSEAERIRQTQNAVVDGLSIDGPHGVPPQSGAAKPGRTPSQCVSICPFVFQERSLLLITIFILSSPRGAPGVERAHK